MAEKYSDLVTCFKNKQRVRSVSNGGTMLCSTASVSLAENSINDVIHLAVLPTSSIIHHIYCTLENTNTTEASQEVNMNFYIFGINTDGSFSSVKNICQTGTTLSGVDAKTVKTVPIPFFQQNYNQTIYQQVYEDESFKPYLNDSFVVLGVYTNLSNSNTVFKIQYSAGSSSQELVKLSADKEY